MARNLRETGIDVVGRVPWGTHFCQFYKTRQDLMDILVPYFMAGLKNNEFCMWVTSKPLSDRQALKALRDVLPDIDDYLEKGQIEIIPHTGWYLEDGVFDARRILRGWIDRCHKARARGYDGLRLSGNTFWLENKDWKSFVEYEGEIGKSIGEYDMIAMCTYSIDRCSAAEIIDVVTNHEFALIKREGEWAVIEDSKHKLALESLRKLNRTLHALNESNQAMMRARDETTFLKDVCRIVAMDCGYSLVWIGYAGEGEDKPVVPVAYAGFAKEYLGKMKISWADTPRGRGPTGTAIRTGRPVRCRNMLADPDFIPWREEALKHGYASSLAVPLVWGGKVFGAMTVYAREPEHFSDDEEKLLVELAGDLSYGITMIRLHAENIRAQEELRMHRDRLEELVKERTAELEDEIARRKKAQDALTINEALLRRAQEVAIIGSWYLDIRANDLSWSDGVYDIFGLPRGTQMNYEKFLDIVHQDDLEYVNRSWKAALAGGAYDIEHRIIVNGAVKWVREKAEVDFSKDGTPLRGIGIVQDITRRKTAEEEQHKLHQSLAHVSRLATVGELTTALAHEINQPLAAILANAQAARHIADEDNPDMKELKEALDDIINDDKRAREVIRRIRSLLKKDSSLPEMTDINLVIQEAVKLIERESVLKGVPIRLNLERSVPQVEADPIQIGQVMVNLLVNAIEAMGEDPGSTRSITVHSRKTDEGEVVVSVHDTGKGIDEKSSRRLFEPFFTTKAHGLGLGLSISRSIIEAHGGRLNAVPNQGRGSTFSFRLPTGRRQGEV